MPETRETSCPVLPSQVALQRICITLLVLSGTLLIGIILMLYSPPVARRDFEIRLLQDKLQAQAVKLAECQVRAARLTDYKQQAQDHDKRVIQYELDKKAQDAFRASESRLKSRLLREITELKDVCHGSRSDR